MFISQILRRKAVKEVSAHIISDIYAKQKQFDE